MRIFFASVNLSVPCLGQFVVARGGGGGGGGDAFRTLLSPRGVCSPTLLALPQSRNRATTAQFNAPNKSRCCGIRCQPEVCLVSPHNVGPHLG